jgi:hypothetical protein
LNSFTSSATVAGLDENSRGCFISRAYHHLFGAVTALVLIESLLFQRGEGEIHCPDVDGHILVTRVA